jgi:hypothetical protein
LLRQIVPLSLNGPPSGMLHPSRMPVFCLLVVSRYLVYLYMVGVAAVFGLQTNW